VNDSSKDEGVTSSHQSGSTSWEAKLLKKNQLNAAFHFQLIDSFFATSLPDLDSRFCG
jgi:hypothetical protein